MKVAIIWKAEQCICSPSCAKKLRMVFDSSWANSIEIVFESVRLLRLVPPGENYLGDLFNASIFIDNLECILR